MDNNWLQERAGKFTSSEIHRLMKSGRSKDQLFGEGAMTYIREVIAEVLTGQAIETRSTEAMEWGKQWESTSVSTFEDKYGFKVDYFGGDNPKFFEHPLYKFSGGSPDALHNVFVLESKCPFNPANHVEILEATTLIDQAEWLKKNKYDYWCQLQFNMLVCKKDNGYLISFDPRMIEDKNKLAVISLDACAEFKADVENRLNEAKKIISETFKKLK